ncbi:MAG: hypothetical protein IJ722_04870 [Alloprevotella sp.]|nr:hypothetical protein [Alloprevotella sp.]
MRKLYACAILMAMSVAVNAQTEQKSVSGDVFVVPKLFTYGDNSYVVAITDDEEVSVYNEDIELVRSFDVNLTEYTTGHERQERKATVNIESMRVAGNIVVWETGETWTGTWNQAQELAASNAPNISDVEEKDHYQFWPTDEGAYWLYEKYGKLHPTFYYQWNAEDGTISWVFVSYRETFTDDWETVDNISWKRGEMEYLAFEDYDDNSHPDQNFCLSQTLFNEDEKFEYIEPIYESKESIQEEYDRDGDGEIDTRTIYRGVRHIGFRIMSEDGSVLQTINTTIHRGGLDIFKINGKIYMVLEDDDETVFFKIDRQSTNITRLAAMPVPAKSIFSLSGRKLPSAQRGVNIVRNSDGSSTKFLMK